MCKNSRLIAHDVLDLTPSHPKSKAIFGVSGFQIIFGCYRINSENRLAPRNSKNTLVGLIFAYLLYISLCLPRKPLQPEFLRIHRNLTSRESENAIREIAFETRVKTRSRLLLWTRVLLKVLDFLIRRPRTSKNLVRQDPDLFMAMFHILPPPTPKVRSYLSSAALKPLFLLSD